MWLKCSFFFCQKKWNGTCNLLVMYGDVYIPIHTHPRNQTILALLFLYSAIFLHCWHPKPGSDPSPSSVSEIIFFSPPFFLLLLFFSLSLALQTNIFGFRDQSIDFIYIYIYICNIYIYIYKREKKERKKQHKTKQKQELNKHKQSYTPDCPSTARRPSLPFEPTEYLCNNPSRSIYLNLHYDFLISKKKWHVIQKYNSRDGPNLKN